MLAFPWRTNGRTTSAEQPPEPPAPVAERSTPPEWHAVEDAMALRGPGMLPRARRLSTPACRSCCE
jgi:hypothetical protein